MEYSQFIEEVKQGNVAKVTIEGRVLKGVKTTGERFTTYSPSDPWLVSDLLKNGVIIEAKPEEEPSLPHEHLRLVVPDAAADRRVDILHAADAGRRPRRRVLVRQEPGAHARRDRTITVTFADVAGCEEAKEEVAELVEFLRDPSQIPEARRAHSARRADGRQPGHRQDAARASAIAGEAKVPFF